jgi:hypothetical protein
VPQCQPLAESKGWEGREATEVVQPSQRSQAIRVRLLHPCCMHSTEGARGSAPVSFQPLLLSARVIEGPSAEVRCGPGTLLEAREEPRLGTVPARRAPLLRGLHQVPPPWAPRVPHSSSASPRPASVSRRPRRSRLPLLNPFTGSDQAQSGINCGEGEAEKGRRAGPLRRLRHRVLPGHAAVAARRGPSEGRPASEASTVRRGLRQFRAGGGGRWRGPAPPSSPPRRS